MKTDMPVEQIALRIRQTILKMAMRAGGGHIAPSYSIADIVAELYFDGILRYDTSNPDWKERDYFILSKGHGALALYVALSMAGFFPQNELQNFCKPGSKLGSLAKAGAAPGVEASTGSLGHGLSYACGIALALKKDNASNKVYALLGDGECEEGSVWEAAMFAAHNELDNLVIIVDYNKLQAMDSLENIMSLDDFSGKFRSFGINSVDIDGHDYEQIRKVLKEPGIQNCNRKKKPLAIIAHTVKGKGISFMENIPIWHYRIPNKEELKVALHDLGMAENDLWAYEFLPYKNII